MIYLFVGKSSITSGKLICCGHYLYLMRINEANDPYFASKQIDEMITKYGNDEDGTIFCTNDGKPLDFVEYDENEGLSKLTGEINEVMEDVKIILPDIQEALRVLYVMCKHENFTKSYGNICG